MKKTAPCYSKTSYYDYFDINMKNKTVLDIGSSVGSFKKSSKFVGSSKNLGGAKKYTTMDIDPKSGADVIGDAHELPFKDRSYDIIVANNVIEHFYDAPKAIKEMKRVLKTGGIIYYTVPFLYPVHEAPHDYVRYTRFGIAHLFKDFERVDVLERGGVFSTIAHYFYKMTHALDSIKLGLVARAIMYPFLLVWVQLDRADNSRAFIRAYFGKAVK
jgi:SAM-dependent methyltransferase